MRIDIVTLFPELCETFLHASILGRAEAKGLFEAHCHQIRDYTTNRQNQTDDYPYGGGCGMVLYAQPIADCLREVQRQNEAQGRGKPHVVFLTAAGQQYNEATARRLAAYDSVTLVCGHYEGIDERVIEAFGDEEISIGDYVLTGGELASLVVADSVLRLQPGVLAEEKGYQEESYWDGLIEYPQYTRPEIWEGRPVPPVLLTGDHTKIDAWRSAQSKARTRARRPDLYQTWRETHPMVLPKLKRNEKIQLVKTEEQRLAAAEISGLEAAAFAAHGQAGYLHSTAGKPDGVVSICHSTGEITRLYVADQSRNQGIGTKLLAFACRKLDGQKPPFAMLPVENIDLVALFTRMGFATDGERIFLQGAGTPLLGCYTYRSTVQQ